MNLAPQVISLGSGIMGPALDCHLHMDSLIVLGEVQEQEPGEKGFIGPITLDPLGVSPRLASA